MVRSKRAHQKVDFGHGTNVGARWRGFFPSRTTESDGNLRSMRESAAKAICHLVATGPRHAGQVFPTLVNWCNDADSAHAERREAMEAICRVIESAHQHVGEGSFPQGRENGCSDECRNVRVSAKMALRRIKFEKAL